MRIELSVLALLSIAALVPVRARAQVGGDCATRDPGPCWVFPRPGTPEAVTLDAPIKVRYTPDFFDQFDQTATAIEVFESETGSLVPGRVQVHGSDVMFFIPEGGWQPNTFYEGSVFGQGGEIAFGFETGSELDRRAPVLGGIVAVAPASGSEAPGFGEGSLRVDLEFEAASDDGPEGSLEYPIYLTRGHGIRSPELRLVRLHQPGIINAAIGLTEQESAEPVCLAVVAVDGVGKTDVSPEECFDPVQGNFFEPLCSVAPRARVSGVAGLLVPLLLALGVARFRRRREVFAPSRHDLN